MASAGVSRSGRVRKKSAKLMEMETLDVSEMDVMQQGKFKKKPNRSFDSGDSDSDKMYEAKKVAPLRIPKAPVTTIVVSPPMKKKLSFLQPSQKLPAMKETVPNISPPMKQQRMVVTMLPKDSSSSSTSSSSSSTTTSSSETSDSDDSSGLMKLPPMKKSSPAAIPQLIRQNMPANQDRQKMHSPVKVVAVPKIMHFEKQSSMSASEASEPPSDSDRDETEHSLTIVEEPVLPKKKKFIKKKGEKMPRKPIMKSTGVEKPEPKRKIAKVKVVRKGGKVKEQKKTRPMTAYMLWCQENRKKIVAIHPDMDFSSISKKMGEVWQSLPDKEKMAWKRKTKKAANKGSSFISTGKTSEARTKVATARHFVPSGTAKSSDDGIRGSIPIDGVRLTVSTPIDVAAHLKLLGESLSIIGQRLTEHEGQIAVSGSLSVLLDSTLCALGPLLCLTSQTKELNGCSSETLSAILDNVAYIMPGL